MPWRRQAGTRVGILSSGPYLSPDWCEQGCHTEMPFSSLLPQGSNSKGRDRGWSRSCGLSMHLSPGPVAPDPTVATHLPLLAEPVLTGLATSFSPVSHAVSWESSSGAGIQLGHQTLCICDQQPLCLGAGCCHLGALRAGTAFLLPWAHSRECGNPCSAASLPGFLRLPLGKAGLKRQGPRVCRVGVSFIALRTVLIRARGMEVRTPGPG